MAQSWTDFTGNSLGTGIPSGWTSGGDGTATGLIATDATVSGFPRAFTYNSGTSSMEQYNAVPSGTAAIEILTLTVLPALSNLTLPISVGRASFGSTFNGYAMVCYDSSGTKLFNIVRYASSVGTAIGGNLPSSTWVAGQAWWSRLNLNGTTVKGKAWLSSNPEPAAWGVTVTDSTYASGLAGSRVSSAGNKILFFSTGTGGDIALSRPSVGGFNLAMMGM